MSTPILIAYDTTHDRIDAQMTIHRALQAARTEVTDEEQVVSDVLEQVSWEDLCSMPMSECLEDFLVAGQCVYVLAIGESARTKIEQTLIHLRKTIGEAYDGRVLSWNLSPVKSWTKKDRARILKVLVEMIRSIELKTLEVRAARQSEPILEAVESGVLHEIEFDWKDLDALLLVQAASGRRWLIRGRHLGSDEAPVRLIDATVRPREPVEQAVALLLPDEIESDPEACDREVETLRDLGYRKVLPLRFQSFRAVMRWLLAAAAGERVRIEVFHQGWDEQVDADSQAA